MDSKRRHELQSNNLSLILLDLPGEIKEHASQILLVLAIMALVASLIYYRVSSRNNNLVIAQTDLATAREAIGELQNPPAIGDVKGYAAYRHARVADASTALTQALSLSTDRKLAAEALIARGDLNWALANATELPGATTQPALQLDQPRDAYLKESQQAYTTVLDQYTDQKEAGVAARFGLAAIAENRHDWDGATKLYQGLASDQTITAAYRDYAAQRLVGLTELKTPVRIGNATTTTAPATRPAAVG